MKRIEIAPPRGVRYPNEAACHDQEGFVCNGYHFASAPRPMHIAEWGAEASRVEYWPVRRTHSKWRSLSEEATASLIINLLRSLQSVVLEGRYRSPPPHVIADPPLTLCAADCSRLTLTHVRGNISGLDSWQGSRVSSERVQLSLCQVFRFHSLHLAIVCARSRNQSARTTCCDLKMVRGGPRG